MVSRRTLRTALAPLGLVLVLVAALSSCERVDATVVLSRLDGATTGTSFVLEVDLAGASEAKLVIDGAYVGRTDTAPLEFAVDVGEGSHDARVTVVRDGDEQRIDATFAAIGGADPVPPGASTPTTIDGPTTTGAPPTTVGRPPTVPAPAPTTTAPTGPAPAGPNGGVVVDTVDELRAAVAAARPGATIVVADGEYQFKPRLVLAASGTASAPITLKGSRRAVLRTKNASGDYGLHITGDHWRVEGLTVAHATKGIVLDGSRGTVIDGVEVFDIGDEAIHFRACSSDGVLRRSFIHDTGRNSPQYGEGVYVGSANSNWGSYQCADPVEDVALGDNTERVLIEDNVFEDITAEGADLKEGTDSGTLRRNTFRRAGTSGQNSADSAVDAKGNNWRIEGNVVTETNAPWDDHGVLSPSELLDGFQSHSVYGGYGTGNLFIGNRVEGTVPGFGIGLYPALANRVTCDNVATGAARGLVGANNKPATCSS